MKDKNAAFLRQLVHPVTLLSVSDGKEENVATISWVSPVSRKPPLIMIAVHPGRFSHDLLLTTGEFAVLILFNLQRELSTLAGTVSGNETNKWKLPQFKMSRKKARYIKAPLLSDCRATMECRLKEHYTAGDHTLFIGEIMDLDVNPDVQPLILFNKKYINPGQYIANYP
jgi:flavin reductase (DIM6/NTAB) family NADH-FMN oxidoreductase RutF